MKRIGDSRTNASRLAGYFTRSVNDLAKVPHHVTLHCLGGAVVEHWTRDRKVAGSTPGRGAIKSTRSTQPSIPLK